MAYGSSIRWTVPFSLRTKAVAPIVRERVLCRRPTGPNPLNHRDVFSRPAPPVNRRRVYTHTLAHSLSLCHTHTPSHTLSHAGTLAAAQSVQRETNLLLPFFITLVTGPRRSLILELSRLSRPLLGHLCGGAYTAAMLFQGQGLASNYM